MTIPRELLMEWVKNLQRGSLTIPRCDACNAWNWYPRSVCMNCGSERFNPDCVGFEGRVHSWTRVYRALPPVQHLPVPYALGIIELDDAPGVRIPCRAVDASRDPTVGEHVHLVIRAEQGEPPFLVFSPTREASADESSHPTLEARLRW